MRSWRAPNRPAAGVRYKPPKSGKGRTVALSATVLEQLRAHRLQQAEELLRLGVRQTDAHVRLYEGGRRADATAEPDSSMAQVLAKTTYLASASMICVTLTRRTCCHRGTSEGGLERLGHSRVGITLDLYSHVFPGMQEDAAARVDDALRRGVTEARVQTPFGSNSVAKGSSAALVNLNR